MEVGAPPYFFAIIYGIIWFDAADWGYNTK